MPAAKNPDDELIRLYSLQQLSVLDSNAEEEFDALVKAASLVCDVPISLISLVDADRQWFKANIGLPGVTETPRELAFCAHAIHGDGILEVNDATQDVRFADNPLVTGDPNIRFYAGATLKLKDGSNVGTLCVIDSKPKSLNEKQLEILECLATAAVKALETRRIREIEKELKENEQKFQQMIQNQSVATFMIDSQHRVTHWNKACEALTGAIATDMIGSTESWRAFYPAPRPCLADLVLEKKQNEVGNHYPKTKKSTLVETGMHAEAWFDGLGGKLRYVIFDAAPIVDLNGNITAVVETLQDITEQKLAEEEVNTLAFYDALTGLPNRRFLLERVDHALALSKRSDKYGALLFIDLNNFKSLNDKMGHDKGDLLLQQVASRLKSCIRESDVVARLGGDEFVLMLENLSEDWLDASDKTKIVGQKMTRTIKQVYDLNGYAYYGTASIGAALLHSKFGKVDDVIKQADKMMYQAKVGNSTELIIYHSDNAQLSELVCSD